MQTPDELKRDLSRYRGLASHITDDAGLKILKDLLDDATALLHAMELGEPPQRLAVALSGGGHRATLFGLGVLLALVDRGLNGRVGQIASVSGGSIANAFVAAHCDFSRTSTEEFDRIAASLVHKIVHKGVLTWQTVSAVLGGIAAPPILLFWLAYHDMISAPLASFLVVVWLGASLLLRGQIIEVLLELRYFAPDVVSTPRTLRLKVKRKRFGSLDQLSTEHVICCTDLIDAIPVFFHSKTGLLYQEDKGPRLEHEVAAGWLYRPVAYIPIASVVRASAAFPGIPPRRFRFSTRKEDLFVFRYRPSDYDLASDLKKTMLLADGGVWNNLGSHVIRERTWGQGDDYGDVGLILADASESLNRQKVFPYYIPVWALIRSLLRIANIQHINTVALRLKPMDDRQTNRLFKRMNEPPWDFPIALRVNSASVQSLLMTEQELATQSPKDYRKLGEVGLDLPLYLAAAELLELQNRILSDIGTHLSRINRDDALGLLARGYLSTVLETALIKPIDLAELDRLKGVPERLRKMTTQDVRR